ncbi:hypothetical protein [Pseudoalteromonas lipolytica]|uniref:hypothetical protein n=1 Tax=Pseudoalteromonas lipolytica TaxID=570156 RepID=UPI000C3E8B05|nr:hypothetical protein [Pseudoalteromonas lipolytica]MAE02320.1 hypothetical protein [Pseudoalteromonas sp.]|tara:strand:+ start:2064 stop:2768 length:705 start_codon:yes stop_codon:yes gene_type:complete
MKEKLSRFLKYFASIHPLINTVACLSLIFSLCYEVWINKLPEVFSWGSELTVILSQMSMAFFSSYIFYVIVVKKKEVDDWENIKPTVALWVLRITSQYKRQLEVLEKASGCSIDQRSITSLTEALKVISPWGPCELRIKSRDGTYLNWYSCLILDQNEVGENIGKLLNIAPFLDSELIAILNTLTGLDVKIVLETFVNNVEGDNLSFIRGVFFQYCKSCENLEEYRLKHLDIFN